MSGRQSRRQDADHEHYDELAVGWALHALEPEDEAGFATHLAGCARCAATVSDAAEAMVAMATDLPGAEPSPGLRDRLRDAVASTEQVQRPAADAVPELVEEPAPSPLPSVVAFPGPAGRAARRHRGRSGWRRALPNGLVAAGVAAILALGVWNVVLTQDRDSAQATAATQASVMQSLLAPGQVTVAPMEHDGRTVATVVARDGQAQVVVDGMTANDTSDSTYVLWGMSDGSPVALGTFDVVADGVDLRTVGSDATGLDDYSAYGISIEPGRSAPSTPTDIVANGQVTS
ncbi:Anti-sigma-K factor rskA [Klenkia soli]|uniref:Regulator of SigK n=1 Tax=Klenkia soli TaxID=1052260 RepID=A0A1H0LY88_9ACTN|nr:anti-sigma factor [Klenkia soli]SDO73168.1 Anti-sigma-K factor rskA [Klenkia soli]